MAVVRSFHLLLLSSSRTVTIALNSSNRWDMVSLITSSEVGLNSPRQPKRCGSKCSTSKSRVYVLVVPHQRQASSKAQPSSLQDCKTSWWPCGSPSPSGATCWNNWLVWIFYSNLKSNHNRSPFSTPTLKMDRGLIKISFHYEWSSNNFR